MMSTYMRRPSRPPVSCGVRVIGSEAESPRDPQEKEPPAAMRVGCVRCVLLPWAARAAAAAARLLQWAAALRGVTTP